MQKKQGLGKITSLTIPEALEDYNAEHGVTRARLKWSFVGSSEPTDDLTTQLLNRVGNNSFSVIIDITDIGLQAAQAAFVGKTAHFTVFQFTIGELTDGKYSLVNNGESEYASLSSPHIGDVNDTSASFDSLQKRLSKDIDEGKLFFGKMKKKKDILTKWRLMLKKTRLMPGY